MREKVTQKFTAMWLAFSLIFTARLIVSDFRQQKLDECFNKKDSISCKRTG